MAPAADPATYNGRAHGHELTPLPTFSVVKLTDERTKTLGECLKKNHEIYAPLRDPKLWFHNHMPHILGSSYYLGGSSSKLLEILKAEGEHLRPQETVPPQNPITRENWRSFLASKDHTVEYARYFDDEIAKTNGDWKKVVTEHLYSGSKPLVNGFCGGLGHPFIHLAYAYEFDSKEVASEALSLGCTEVDFMHKYFDNPPADTGKSTYKTKDLLEILGRVVDDKRFDGLFEHPGFMNTFAIHAKAEDVLLEHYNAFVLDDVEVQFEQIFDVAARIAVETGDAERQFDFFLIHILTAFHALRVILPYAPVEHRGNMVKQFVMWTLLMYVAQLRRPVQTDLVKKVDLKGRGWDYVRDQALNSRFSLDSHYVKVVRALKVGEELYGEKDGWYLKAAIKFVDEYREWTGFGLGVE
ncbi:hypothetical protein HRR83_007641 [Exophiala dermatitidis]|uniref:MGS207 protein n=2 Tax=Exophiala dermatitidis TaxID=5970 RepID=H6BL60_EXODN|nr:uncharacterized protein HMPREF1120_01015 [Exophiala dermatitidis NIH/UT8656]KAJ4507828.1 hypothetical protein HRR75_006538 [Exophiala dermatitidis]EHY52808.1 hypothetical protein HMPREF1120_01015 [Exophiala dermatitidis NIH/UT8656]KAJ4509970.1 hypothetical protein HRR74_007122 [Exophiala dermatitidis]KAJ4521779.1 hypothetical protein HRR73_002977 [Exophiala dermatitidis]KAJ4539473.1 hypothetical protein HRR77_006357 [Exophiala dermatitidis]